MIERIRYWANFHQKWPVLKLTVAYFAIGAGRPALRLKERGLSGHCDQEDGSGEEQERRALEEIGSAIRLHVRDTRKSEQRCEHYQCDRMALHVAERV